MATRRKMPPTKGRPTRWRRDSETWPGALRQGFSPNRAQQVCRTRFQRPEQNRPVAAFGQAATGRTRNELARGTAIGARWRGHQPNLCAGFAVALNRKLSTRGTAITLTAKADSQMAPGH